MTNERDARNPLPPFLGGQGRSAEEVESSGVLLAFMGALTLGLLAAAVAHRLGWL